MTSVTRSLGPALIGLLLASTPALASRQYRLDFTILQDGRIVSAPSVVVVEGRRADLTVHDEAAQPNHDLRLLVTAKPAAERVRGKDVIQASLVLYEGVDGEWVLRSEPEISIYLGEQASLTVGSEGLERNAPTYEIKVTASLPAPDSTAGKKGGKTG